MNWFQKNSNNFIPWFLPNATITGSSISGHKPVFGSLWQLVEHSQEVFQVVRHVPITISSLLFSNRLFGMAIAGSALSCTWLTSFWAHFAHLLNVGNLKQIFFVASLICNGIIAGQRILLIVKIKKPT
jgi:hypothetical protein